MSWNWNLVLNAVIFWFVGILTGIFALMIILSVDVDLSQFDGTSIATIVLAIATTVLVLVTRQYAKSTKEILDEQRKSRKIAETERKIALTKKELSDFYNPLDNFLKRYFSYRNQGRLLGREPERHLQVTNDLHNTGTRNNLMEYKDIIKHNYLANEDIQDNLNDFLDEKNISKQTIKDTDVLTLYDTLVLDVEGKIVSLNKKLTDLTRELSDLYYSQD